MKVVLSGFDENSLLEEFLLLFRNERRLIKLENEPIKFAQALANR
jgi:hypothetical protein